MNLDLSKIIDSFNKLNDQARYGALAGVVLLVILLDVFFLTIPQVNSIGRTNDQINKIAGETLEVSTGRQRLDQLKKNLDLTRSQFSAVNLKLRPLQEVPAILSAISSIANEYGVKIDQLVPEKNGQESLKALSSSKFYALPVVIKAHSGYHMFGRFLNKLENEDLYFIMNDFIIQNDSADTQLHSFTLTIKIILVDKKPGQN